MQDLSEVMGVLRLEDSQQLREFLGNLRAREEKLADEAKAREERLAKLADEAKAREERLAEAAKLADEAKAREERLAEELRRAQQEAADATAAKRQAEEKLALQSFQPPAAAQSAPANRA